MSSARAEPRREVRGESLCHGLYRQPRATPHRTAVRSELDVVHGRARLCGLARDHVGDRRAGEDLAGGGRRVGEDAVRVAADGTVEELDDLERADLAGRPGEG